MAGTGNRNRQNRFPRNRKRNRNRRNRFSGTEAGIGTVLFCQNNIETCTKPLPQRNRRNRQPEPLEPSRARTVTEPNRTGATLFPKNLFGLLLTSKGYFLRFRRLFEITSAKMHSKTRENCPFSGLFLGFRVILTSGGYLLRLALIKDS